MRLYESVVDQVRDYVEKGIYGPGTKLPSVRKLSARLNVSVSTVLQAYARLEDMGVVEAVPQSGYFVRCIPRGPRALPATAGRPNCPADDSSNRLALEILRFGDRRGTVQFGTALPCVDFPMVGELTRLTSSIARARRYRVGCYASPLGYSKLRLQIARRLIEAEMTVSPDEIIITTGCQEALMLALRAAAKAGEFVAVESPGYPGLLQLIESLEMRPLGIPASAETGISLEALSQALERWPVKALVLVPQFSNPLGYRMPDENKRRLLELLDEHDVLLIEDDIYGELGYSDRRQRAIKSWDEKGRVLYCSSFSKTLGPGLRVGWMVAGRYIDAVEHLKFTISMTTGTLAQIAIAEFLETKDYDRHLCTVRSAYRERRDELARLVAEHFPASTRLTQPQGGYLAWLELPESFDSVRLFHDAMEIGISTAPGSLFSTDDKFRHCLRMNYAMPWGREYADGLIRLARLVDRQLAEPYRSTRS